MFIGHFGVGFALKSLAPRISLGTLFLAAQFIDLLWPSLLLLGLERVEIAPGITQVTPLDFTHYPISHSLLAVVGWALLFALVYFLLSRSPKAAIACAIAVLSHWLLDLLTHRPDLPLYPGNSPLFGFGLWDSLAATLAVEVSIFAVGIYLYLRNTTARDRIGSIGFWALVLFLLAIYIGNLFGAPPPNTTALAWVGQAQWLLVAWGYWIDRHRRTLDFNFA
jgi:FtsH-binding integral membrane protein